MLQGLIRGTLQRYSMKRTREIKIRLSEKEWQTWTSKARDAQMTTADFVRSRLRGAGRPKPGRKPVEPRCEHGIPESEWPCPNCDAILQAELDAEAAEKACYGERQAAFATERAREAEGRRLARAAGGAEKWLAGMSPSDPWFDVARDMASSERANREADEMFRRDHGGLSLEELLEQQYNERVEREKKERQERAEAAERERRDAAERTPETEQERRQWALKQVRAWGGSVQNWYSSLPSRVTEEWADLYPWLVDAVAKSPQKPEPSYRPLQPLTGILEHDLQFIEDRTAPNVKQHIVSRDVRTTVEPADPRDLISEDGFRNFD
jgi:hypothetical protein